MVSVCHTCYERGIIILYLFVCLFVHTTLVALLHMKCVVRLLWARHHNSL